MDFSIYLHQYVIDILSYFGNINDVINKMLTDLLAADIDIMDKPKAPNRDDAKRLTITITNKEYLELLNTFGINSSKISLRRLIYWFIDNTIYEDLNWTAKSYSIEKDMHLSNAINKVFSICEKAKKYTSNYNITLFNQLLTIIKDLKEQLNHEY